MSEETTVGTIRGVLTMDDSPWSKTIEEAKAKARELGRTNPNIKIDVDAAGALTKLSAVKIAMNGLTEAQTKVSVAQKALSDLQAKGDAPAAKLATAQRNLDSAMRGSENAALRLAAAYEKVGATTDEVEKKSKDAGKGMGLLLTSILAIGPALIPLAAVGVGAMAGLAATAGTALLVFAGIKDAMAQGTTIGKQYTAGMALLNKEFTTLKQLAAAGFLGGFNAGLAALRPLFSTLNRDVALFSTQLGGIVGHLVPGLVALFHQLNPLFVTFGNMLLSGSANFQHWAQSSTAVSKFVAYVQNELPNVLHFLGELTTLVGHLAQAFAPLGSGTLTTLGLLAQAINAIPIHVLQALVPLVTASVLAFKGFSALSGISDKLQAMSVRMSQAGASAQAASGMVAGASSAVRFLGIAGLVAGPAIGILTSIMAKHQQTAAEETQAVNTLTDALIRSNGVIDDNIRATTAKQFADDGTAAAARKLGISVSDLTSAALGNADAIARVHKVTDMYSGAVDNSSGSAASAVYSYASLDKEVGKVTDAVGGGNKALAGAKQKYADYKAGVDQATNANNQSAAAAKAAAVAADDQARKYGTTATAMQVATAAAKSQADSTRAATLAMQLENDAAGLLRQALDALNGKALNAADAQNAFDSSLVNMGDHVTATGKKVKFTTTSIRDMSSASVALRGELNGQIHNLEGVVEANGGWAKSTVKSRAEMAKLRQQIIDNAVAHGVDRKAVTDYVNEFFKIPKSVPPTKLDVDNATAYNKLKSVHDAINDIPRNISIMLNIGVNNSVGQAVHDAVNSIPGKKVSAEGSTVRGPGSGTSDSVGPYWLSNGEEVINAKQAAKFRPLLKSINAGQLATGGTAGINRPAATSSFAASAPTAPAVHVAAPIVKVFIDGQEFRGMVRVEVDGQMSNLADSLNYGRKS